MTNWTPFGLNRRARNGYCKPTWPQVHKCHLGQGLRWSIAKTLTLLTLQTILKSLSLHCHWKTTSNTLLYKSSWRWGKWKHAANLSLFSSNREHTSPEAKYTRPSPSEPLLIFAQFPWAKLASDLLPYSDKTVFVWAFKTFHFQHMFALFLSAPSLKQAKRHGPEWCCPAVTFPVQINKWRIYKHLKAISPQAI